MWMGGWPPLGYEVQDRRLVVVEQLAGALFDEQQALQARQRLMDEGRSVIDRSRTATEQHAAEVAKLNQLLQAGAIDQATYARVVEDANDHALRSSQAWTDGATRFLKDYVAESNDAATATGVRECVQALAHRLSFRRFVGLALADPVPDHSTLSRFRSELVRRGLSERLLVELNRQLAARGLVVKSGTLIDASLVEADCRRPRKGEPKERRSDQDASWNAMPEKPRFSYKMHLAVDQGSGLVRRAILTPGHVSDKAPFLALVQGEEQAVYADRGYDGWWYRQELALRGIADGIMATTGGGRSMPPVMPATGRSHLSGRRSSAASRSSSAGTAIAALPAVSGGAKIPHL
jgi:IS5 family transposase